MLVSSLNYACLGHLGPTISLSVEEQNYNSSEAPYSFSISSSALSFRPCAFISVPYASPLSWSTSSSSLLKQYFESTHCPHLLSLGLSLWFSKSSPMASPLSKPSSFLLNCSICILLLLLLYHPRHILYNHYHYHSLGHHTKSILCITTIYNTITLKSTMPFYKSILLSSSSSYMASSPLSPPSIYSDWSYISFLSSSPMSKSISTLSFISLNLQQSHH